MKTVYDPFEPEVRLDPHPVYRCLRDEAPCYWAEGPGTWVLSRHDDVAWALKATTQFSSDAVRGVQLGAPMGSGTEPLPRSIAGGNIVSIDDPAHRQLRSIVNRGFTPRRIEEWRARIEEVVVEELAGGQNDGPFDVIEAVARPLPVRIIAEMLGADSGEADRFMEWADAVTRLMSGSQRGALPGEAAVSMVSGIREHVTSVVADRRSCPMEDMITVLVQASDQDVLSEAETIGFASLLLFAGSETTTNLIGNTCLALVTHPDELARTIDDPDRLPRVLEETLRWDAPVQYVFRRATGHVEIHGAEIRADDIVTLVLAAANRDPRQWGSTADRFDPDRVAATHVSFGLGPHFCLGASLARLEALVALEHLLPLLADGVLVDDEPPLIDSAQFRGRRQLLIERRGTR